MAYNCVLLDFDDTIVDFKKSERESLEKLYNKYNIPVNDENIAIFIENNKKLWAEFDKGKIKKHIIEMQRFTPLVEKFNLKDVKSEVLNKDYLNFLKQSVHLYDGALEFLQDIEDFATLAIITNGIEHVQNNRLKLSGIQDFFDGVFTSEKMGFAKPDKRAFLTPLKTLGIENFEKVLMVGDNLNTDIKGANYANIDTCWINFDNKENTTNIKPKYTAVDFMQLKSIILGG